MKELGPYMRQRREAQSMTQEYVARRIDVSTRQLMRWEAGDAAPNIENLARWLFILNVAYDEIKHYLLPSP